MYHSPILTGKKTSDFGPRNGDLHAGVDIAAPRYVTPVIAIKNAWTINHYSAGYGNYIDLFFDGDYKQNLSAPSKQYMARYAHLAFSAVNDHQFVKKGEIIGYVGSTGNSTGAHLHFELHLPTIGLQPDDWGYKPWRHGVVNPLEYIEFELDGEVINPLSDWRVEQGNLELERLVEDGLINNPENYNTPEKMLSAVPYWLHWTMMNRVRDESTVAIELLNKELEYVKNEHEKLKETLMNLAENLIIKLKEE